MAPVTAPFAMWLALTSTRNGFRIPHHRRCHVMLSPILTVVPTCNIPGTTITTQNSTPTPDRCRQIRQIQLETNFKQQPDLQRATSAWKAETRMCPPKWRGLSENGYGFEAACELVYLVQTLLRILGYTLGDSGRRRLPTNAYEVLADEAVAARRILSFYSPLERCGDCQRHRGHLRFDMKR